MQLHLFSPTRRHGVVITTGKGTRRSEFVSLLTGGWTWLSKPPPFQRSYTFPLNCFTLICVLNTNLCTELGHTCLR